MNKRWRNEKFAASPIQIIDGDRGKNYPKQTEFLDSGYCLFLNTGNVTADGFNFSNCQFITEEKDQLLRKGRLWRNDVVMTTRGTIGNVGYFNDRIPFDHVRINSGMVIFQTDPTQILPIFLYQFLRSPYFKGQINSLRTGAAQPQLPIRDIKCIDIPIPPLDTQKRIADILSAYDDLIENNRRRIELLEQAARLLYREWFVHLRFPGHEHVKFTDGVPEGWYKTTLGQKVILNYGKALKADDRIDGSYPVYGSSGVVGTHEKPLVKGPGIIVGRKGNVGTIFWSSKDFCPIDTVYFIDSETSSHYLYHALQHMQFMSSDAAVPGLNRKYAYSRQYLLPDHMVLSLFEENVSAIYEQIKNLGRYNEKLCEARDILLPRLMNGEITV